MNELFLLDKKIDLHNGANYSEWQTLRVVKPSMVSVEGEIPDIISVSISQRPKEDSKGITNALTFDLTQREAEDLLIALSKSVTKGVKCPVQERLIGKKIKATPAHESHRKSKGLKNYEYWEIEKPHNAGDLQLKSSEGDYTLYTTWDALLGEDPIFRLLEESDIQLISETNFKTLPPPVFANGDRFQKIPPGPDAYQYPTVLDAAKSLVYGDRVNDYGKTSDNFKNICAGWKIIFEPGFTPERVGLAMAWLKICRASNDNCEKEDSLVDCCGYIACVEKVKAGI
jgi:hypothetical protein